LNISRVLARFFIKMTKCRVFFFYFKNYFFVYNVWAMNPVRDREVMYYVYVLQSKRDCKLYTGSTDNLRKRLWQHNNGKSTYTKSGGSWKVVYYEASLCEKDARSREKYLKSGMGKRYLRNRMRRFLSLTG
jgi:putative endonuclease